MNVTDEDGDTPLYVVENVETARFLVEHGAVVQRTNHEGISPVEHLSEDFPDVSAYLSSLPTTTSDSTLSPLPTSTTTQTPSQHAQNRISEQLTSSLLQNVQGIMQRAEEEGREPDEEELRQIVGRTVLDGMLTGYGLGSEGQGTSEERREDGDEVHGDVKRPRMDEPS